MRGKYYRICNIFTQVLSTMRHIADAARRRGWSVPRFHLESPRGRETVYTMKNASLLMLVVFTILYKPSVLPISRGLILAWRVMNVY
ncbi:hypothetical protein PUN28_004739 [Cardiocondyla obscurior]|uniref:Uncharacterized protein n=1 Tax=Cardiocondyla obscurior TaxID=286306 RepID=A0AAW2GIF3_9HYME